MRDKLSPGAWAALVLVGVFVVAALLFGFTVVSTEDEAALTEEFDPVAFVQDNWEAIQTSIRDNAVPLADVLNRMEPDAEGKIATEELTPVAEELGLITTGEAHVYRINGAATVTDVDTGTSRGSIGLAIDGYEGPIEVRAWIGRRIPSDDSSIRDGSGFIEFGDFREQTEYGSVAREINREVVAGLEGLDTENLEGKSVDLTGAFTLRTFNQPIIDISEIVLVPIEISER